VRARVSGYIDRIAFKEGNEVKAGDLLFVIDPRPYRAAYDSAVAQLARARAAEQLAQEQERRAQDLIAAKAGIVGVDAEGRLPLDFRSQAENVFTTLEAILDEAGATLDDVASLNSYHVGDIHSELRELVDIKATRIQAPHPIWTGVGVTQLGVRGALLELSAVAVARD
jgi:multidrug efflux pump subunit AcrA (membrane-fusion protein)